MKTHGDAAGPGGLQGRLRPLAANLAILSRLEASTHKSTWYANANSLEMLPLAIFAFLAVSSAP